MSARAGPSLPTRTSTINRTITITSTHASSSRRGTDTTITTTTHDHAHIHHDHDDHHHGHQHGPGGHTHDLPSDVPPLSRRGLILLASSGGLLPSPSAVLALLGAFVAGRAALGFGLVAAFSIGLAVTLTGIGLALVLGGRVIERRGLGNHRLVSWLPLGSAVAIAVVGLVIASQGVTRL